jgi:hypothetical protein
LDIEPVSMERRFKLAMLLAREIVTL